MFLFPKNLLTGMSVYAESNIEFLYTPTANVTSSSAFLPDRKAPQAQTSPAFPRLRWCRVPRHGWGTALGEEKASDCLQTALVFDAQTSSQSQKLHKHPCTMQHCTQSSQVVPHVCRPSPPPWGGGEGVAVAVVLLLPPSHDVARLCAAHCGCVCVWTLPKCQARARPPAKGPPAPQTPLWVWLCARTHPHAACDGCRCLFPCVCVA